MDTRSADSSKFTNESLLRSHSGLLTGVRRLKVASRTFVGEHLRLKRSVFVINLLRNAGILVLGVAVVGEAHFQDMTSCSFDKQFFCHRKQLFNKKQFPEKLFALSFKSFGVKSPEITLICVSATMPTLLQTFACENNGRLVRWKIPRSGKSPATRDASNEFPTISLGFTTKRAAFYIQFHKLTSAEAHEILLLQPRARQEEEEVVVKKHITLISCITTFSTLALFKWRKYPKTKSETWALSARKLTFYTRASPGRATFTRPAYEFYVCHLSIWTHFAALNKNFFFRRLELNSRKIGNREMFETGFHVLYALGRGAKTERLLTQSTKRFFSGGT